MEKKSLYTVGKVVPTWKLGNSQTITFVVTEDCNLRCKYCYITHKKSNKKMTLDTAKKFINYMLEGNIAYQEAVVLEFIGGEPLLEIELIDTIVDYFKIKAFELNHEWYWNYRINICTNGINYGSKEVQMFIMKNTTNLSLSISIDGTEKKHDLQRVFPNGNGSYKEIMKILPLFLSQFTGSTKVTFASDDLVYLKDSVISLWNKGIKNVSANVVFENVWKEGDDVILEKQLVSLADYVLENRLYDKYYCSFFDDTIGYYYDRDSINHTYCGAGKMLAMGPNGNFYPCIRYKDYSLNNKEEWLFGNVESGIDMEKVRPFMLATVKLQSESECLNCSIASGCGFCQGFNYDEALTPTNFSRATHICKMHKARVRANDYYFSKLFNMYDIEKEQQKLKKNSTILIMSNDYVSFCDFENTCEDRAVMNYNIIIQSLEYARNCFSDPIMIHSKNKFDYKHMPEFDNYRIKHILPIKFFNEAQTEIMKECVYVVDSDEVKQLEEIFVNKCILNIKSENISKCASIVIELFDYTNIIELNVTELDSSFNLLEYQEQLTKINRYLIPLNNSDKKINILMGDFYENDEFENHCTAGTKTFTISPKGEIHICPAFYTNNNENIGNIKDGVTKFDNRNLFESEFQPLCNICDASHCRNCYYMNVKSTNEVNVPPSYKCRKAYIEREAIMNLIFERNQQKKVVELDYNDPIEKWLLSNNGLTGYYVNK